jgi:hypothetical protein
MNIFLPSPTPYNSVIALDDKRIVKMVLETAQLLCTAVHLSDELEEFRDLELYKATHINHPCNKWTRETMDNWRYLFQYFIAICNEYHFRYDKIHASYEKLYRPLTIIDCFLYERKYHFMAHTSFVNCTKNPEYDFTHLPVHEAYKEVLKYKWCHDKRKPTWTNRQRPTWSET